MKVYIHQLGHTAQSYYREQLPAKHVKVEGVELNCSPSMEHENYDAYIWPRVPQPHMLPTIHRLKRQGKKIIASWDDDPFSIPNWNPAGKVFAIPKVMDSTRWMLDIADHILVSTKPLADVIKAKTGRDASICPNLIDLNDWPELPPRQPGPIRILWAGSQHHDADLDVIVEPLERILTEYGDKVQILFCGDWPHGMVTWAKIPYSHLARHVPHPRYEGRVGLVDPVELKDYPRTMCILRPDIGLAPLSDCAFNESKSYIKFLEYALAGGATIATKMPPYQFATVQYATDWHTEIKRLIDDQKARESAADSQRDWVIRHATWQHSALKAMWEEFFANL